MIHLWVNATVDRFLDHAPKRILEHGCGNGMLLYRAALHPGVEEVTESARACGYYLVQIAMQASRGGTIFWL